MKSKLIYLVAMTAIAVGCAKDNEKHPSSSSNTKVTTLSGCPKIAEDDYSTKVEGDVTIVHVKSSADTLSFQLGDDPPFIMSDLMQNGRKASCENGKILLQEQVGNGLKTYQLVKNTEGGFDVVSPEGSVVTYVALSLQKQAAADQAIKISPKTDSKTEQTTPVAPAPVVKATPQTQAPVASTSTKTVPNVIVTPVPAPVPDRSVRQLTDSVGDAVDSMGRAFVRTGHRISRVFGAVRDDPHAGIDRFDTSATHFVQRVYRFAEKPSYNIGRTADHAVHAIDGAVSATADFVVPPVVAVANGIQNGVIYAADKTATYIANTPDRIYSAAVNTGRVTVKANWKQEQKVDKWLKTTPTLHWWEYDQNGKFIGNQGYPINNGR